MVDRQHRPGARTGSGGPASEQDENLQRRERLKKLAMETIDLTKDPYFMKNHLGTYECRLCLTLHSNEGSYLAHTQGKKHQTNLARRNQNGTKEQIIIPQKKPVINLSKTVKIGTPAHKIYKTIDQETGQKAITCEIDFKDIDENIIPRYRIMSTYEQKIEPQDKNYQYLVMAAEPYLNFAFKIPNIEIDQSQDKFNVKWDAQKKVFVLHLTFKNQKIRN